MDMNAEKSLSLRLSRKNISVAGKAAHSVMAFILIVAACSSLKAAESNWDQGMSRSISQRTDSNWRNNSGYNMSPF